MHPKLITAILIAALGLGQAGVSLAAGETPSKRSGASRENVIGRTVFQALVGEFALQRGDTSLGSDAWADLAVRTRNPKVIARATEVAGFAKQYDRALELTKLWLEVEPESMKARQTQSTLLVMANRIDDLAPQLTALLEKDKAALPGNLMHLNRMLARHTDKQAVQKLVDRVAAPYENVPEAHFAMAQAAANAGDNLRALAETERALALRPDWEAAALARAQLQAAGKDGDGRQAGFSGHYGLSLAQRGAPCSNQSNGQGHWAQGKATRGQCGMSHEEPWKSKKSDANRTATAVRGARRATAHAGTDPPAL